MKKDEEDKLKSLNFPPRPGEDEEVEPVRRLVSAFEQKKASRGTSAPLSSDDLDGFDKDTAKNIAALGERRVSKGLPLAWTRYHSHVGRNTNPRDATDLVYPAYAIVEVLAHCGLNWSLGQYEGCIGVLPRDDITDHLLVRSIRDLDVSSQPFSHSQEGDRTLIKGDLFPIAFDPILESWKGFNPVFSHIVSTKDIFPVNKTDIKAVYLEKANDAEIYEEHYTHLPLRAGYLDKDSPEQTQFRLIKITTHELAQYVRCKRRSIFVALEEHNIQEAPAFCALSYPWGNRNDEEMILVNGKLLDIPSSLARMIRWIFSDIENKPRTEDVFYLWADAICIDQRDEEEKRVQIPLMSRIFSNAIEVKLYAGETDGSRIVFSTLHNLSKQLGEFSGRISGSVMERMLRDADFIRLYKFVSLPVFRRRWVIQELVLSSKLHLYYGQSSIDWEHLMSDLSEIHRRCIFSSLSSTDPRHRFSEALEYLIGLSTLRLRWRDKRPLEFTETLALLREAVCRDERDTVYSLLGLADPSWRAAIVPDYKISRPAGIYMQVAEHAAKTRLIKDILSEGGMSKQSNIQSLPSWIPDWSHWVRGDMIPNRALFRCSGQSRLRVRLHDHGETGKSLAVYGALVDVIGAVNSPWPTDRLSHNGQSDNNDELKELGVVNACYLVHNSFQRLCQTWTKFMAATFPDIDTPYDTEEEIIAAVWQTILCGQLDRSRRLKDEDRSLYESFLVSKKRLFHLAKSNRLAYFRDQILPGGKVAQAPQQDHGLLFLSNMRDVQQGNRLCITGTGRYGTVPDEAKTGDLIAVFSGFEMPFVIRRGEIWTDWNHDEPLPSGDFKLIGPAYVHGIMDGELVVDSNKLYGNVRNSDGSDSLKQSSRNASKAEAREGGFDDVDSTFVVRGAKSSYIILD